MTQLVYSDLRTNEERFIYVGMSGRSIKPGMEIPNRRHGIVTRLHSHASGRRSGDQFCVYVADRFVLSTLSSEDIEGIASGRMVGDPRSEAN